MLIHNDKLKILLL